MNYLKFLLFILVIAGLGFGLFAFLAYRSSSLTPTSHELALLEFDRVLAAHQERGPVLVRGDFGMAERNLPTPTLPVPNPEQLRVLAFVADRELLVRADVPYWFFRVKGPFVNIALRETDYDMNDLGISPGSLAEYGPGLVIDDLRPNGDRILIWLE